MYQEGWVDPLKPIDINGISEEKPLDIIFAFDNFKFNPTVTVWIRVERVNAFESVIFQTKDHKTTVHPSG